MENTSTWDPWGVPMPCVSCSQMYPCHFTGQREMSVPLDMPLTINTNIEYELDADMFPDLNSHNSELALMTAPVIGEATGEATQTSIQCPAQTLVATPLPSEDMQCSSGYASEEEDYPILEEQGLDTPGIVSLIDSFRDTAYIDNTQECSNYGVQQALVTEQRHLVDQQDRTREQNLPTALGDTLQEFLNTVTQSGLVCDNFQWNYNEDLSDRSLSLSRDACVSRDWTAVSMYDASVGNCDAQQQDSAPSVQPGYHGFVDSHKQFSTSLNWGSMAFNPIPV